MVRFYTLLCFGSTSSTAAGSRLFRSSWGVVFRFAAGLAAGIVRFIAFAGFIAAEFAAAILLGRAIALDIANGFVAGRNFPSRGRNRAFVFFDVVFHTGTDLGTHIDTEGFCNGGTDLVEVRNPVAYAVNVEWAARNHVGFEAIALGFFEGAGQLEQLAEGKVGFNGAHNFPDDAR